MKPLLQSDIPASARVTSLVRRHHGLPSEGIGEVPVSAAMLNSRLARVWRTGAQLNHLNARRRRMRLDDIPASAFPVVLELKEGSQFLILKERIQERTSVSYLVQFADSRESLVRAERIREIYDGTCVFFSPRDAVHGGGTGPGQTGGGILRRMFSRITSFPMKRGITVAILCNSVALAAVLAVVFSLRLAFPETGVPSIFLPTIGVFMAAAVLPGILRIRRETLTDRVPAALVDCAFIPLYGVAMLFLAGWSATPFFWIAGIVAACLLLSDRLGQIPSRLRGARALILVTTFITGAAGCWTCAFLGLLNPAVMAGVIVLGTYLVNLLIESDILCQEVRLATIV